MSSGIGILTQRLTLCVCSKDRCDDLVNYLVEIDLLDTAEATLNIALDIAREDLAFHEAGLGEGKAFYHIVGQRIGILRIDPVV